MPRAKFRVVVDQNHDGAKPFRSERAAYTWINNEGRALATERILIEVNEGHGYGWQTYEVLEGGQL